MLVLLAPLLACTPAATVSAPSGDVIIGGHSYRLPDEAFADGMVDHGPQDQLLLELSVPVKTGVEPATVQLLLTAPRTSDDRERERQVAESIRLGAHADASDVVHTKYPLTPAVSVALDAPHGFVQVVNRQAASPFNLDVFVRPPIAEAGEFIGCTRHLLGLPGRSCHYEFPAPGMAVRASYERDYISYSGTIRSYVLKYLHSHEVR